MREATPPLEYKVTGALVTAIDPADLSEKYAWAEHEAPG
jgi:hypothetical protein